MQELIASDLLLPEARLSSSKTMHRHIVLITQSSYAMMHPLIYPDTYPAN